MAYADSQDGMSMPPPSLTPRERDCLRLLSAGLLASEVKAELAISQSTLDAHLASARRKLDARTTLQAVLRFSEENKTQSGNASDLAAILGSRPGDLSEAQIGFLDRLEDCESFTHAWNALQDYLSNFDIFTVHFGVIADPAGEMDRSNVSFWSAASDELASLYNTEEMARHDPIARHIATSTEPRIFDVEASLPWLKEQIGHIPLVVEYLMDYGKAGGLCIPARDSLTGAAVGMNLPLAVKQQRDLRLAASAHMSELSQSLILFWHALQQNRLIASRPGLTPREQEALQFVARGFPIAEIAEQIHVSKRAAEQFLAGARAKLGARNNGQAIYRAMVYRALQ